MVPVSFFVATIPIDIKTVGTGVDDHGLGIG